MKQLTAIKIVSNFFGNNSYLKVGALHYTRKYANQVLQFKEKNTTPNPNKNQQKTPKTHHINNLAHFTDQTRQKLFKLDCNLPLPTTCQHNKSSITNTCEFPLFHAQSFNIKPMDLDMTALIQIRKY